MKRLSAWIVNHRSGGFCVRCVESLMEEWRAAGGDPSGLEVIVVDSGSGDGEARWWDELRRLGARVVVRESNVGYAKGMAAARAHATVGPDDLVAVLNPDLYFLSGSVERLLVAFDNDPKLDVAAPRAFIDEHEQLLLPPQTPPTPWAELADVASHRFPRWARRRARRRTRRDLGHWAAEGPHDEAMLSGACLFLRRSLLDRIGDVFDPRYPLYYEDADLAQRLRRDGARTRLIPGAKVLHHWSRSAGAGEDFAGEPARRHAQSRARYFARWFGPLRTRVATALRAHFERVVTRRGHRPMHAFEDLGVVTEAPRLEFAEEDVVLEWSLTPNFSLAAGMLVEGAGARLSALGWSWLFPGRYYLRALCRRDLCLVGAWTLVKETPARSWPVDPQALAPSQRRSYRRVDGDEVERWR